MNEFEQLVVVKVNIIEKIKYLILFVFSLLITFYFVSEKEEQLNNEAIHHLRYLSDSIYRYQINVFNSNDEKIENIKTNDIISYNKPEHMKSVKLISNNINALYQTISSNPIIDSSIWTIADIYPQYIYMKPLRDEYRYMITRHSQHGGYFQYLLDIEKIDENIKNKADTIYEKIRVYGPYVEQDTGEVLYTIYYPLYLERRVSSVLLLDIKENFITKFIDKFNMNNFVFFELKPNYTEELSQYLLEVLAQKNHKANRQLPLRINTIYIVGFASFIFIIFSALIFTITYLIKYIHNNKIDRLTGFYRKDQYAAVNPVVNCILVIDIDHFKQINDTYGHPVGDKVIAEVSARVKRTIRTSDIGIRWGGEEFVIILEGKILKKDLENRLNELLLVINKTPINDIQVTISIGAISTTDGLLLSTAFQHADDALYVAKRSGRNRYCISDKHA